jgi:hypothetical protein
MRWCIWRLLFLLRFNLGKFWHYRIGFGLPLKNSSMLRWAKWQEKALFAFAQSIGLSVVNARQKPKLGSVINYHEPSAISRCKKSSH